VEDLVKVEYLLQHKLGDVMYISKENPVTQEIRSYETNLNLAYKEQNDERLFFVTKHLITRWFNIMNEEIFNNKIYPFYTIDIKRKQGCHAEHISHEDNNGSIYGELSISDRFINKNEFLYTLAHEMVHQWQWMNLYTSNHGQSFWKWKNRLSKFEIPLGVSI